MLKYKVYSPKEIKESLSQSLDIRLSLVDEIFEFSQSTMTDEAKQAREYLQNNRNLWEIYHPEYCSEK